MTPKQRRVLKSGIADMPPFSIAAAGSSISDATALKDGFNVVTGGDGTKGVKLPNIAIGTAVKVKNNASSALKVYPPTSTGVINALQAGAAISMAANVPATFYRQTATQWWTEPLLPS